MADLHRPNVLFYCGGFQPLGGVESFTADLMQVVLSRQYRISAALWGRPLHQLPQLIPIRRAALEFRRSPVRWGCRWNIPDQVLLPAAMPMVRRADLLIFAKVMPHQIHTALRKITRIDGRPIPALLITPYRPAEIWPAGGVDSLLSCFDAIAVQAPSFAEDLRALGYRGRVEVLPLLPPVATPLAPSAHRTGEILRLGYLGRLEQQKNIPYLLDLFDTIFLSQPDAFELHLFGDGSLRADLEQRAAKSPASSRITFHGAVGGQAKWDAIDRCDLFLNCAWTEGQCLVALEVLSRGRPFIATPVGALPELIDSPDMGALIPQNDVHVAANILLATAARWRSGTLSPQAVRSHYERRLGRDVTVAGYMNLIDEMTAAR